MTLRNPIHPVSQAINFRVPFLHPGTIQQLAQNLFQGVISWIGSIGALLHLDHALPFYR